MKRKLSCENPLLKKSKLGNEDTISYFGMNFDEIVSNGEFSEMPLEVWNIITEYVSDIEDYKILLSLNKQIRLNTIDILISSYGSYYNSNLPFQIYGIYLEKSLFTYDLFKESLDKKYPEQLEFNCNINSKNLQFQKMKEKDEHIDLCANIISSQIKSHDVNFIVDEDVHISRYMPVSDVPDGHYQEFKEKVIQIDSFDGDSINVRDICMYDPAYANYDELYDYHEDYEVIPQMINYLYKNGYHINNYLGSLYYLFRGKKDIRHDSIKKSIQKIGVFEFLRLSLRNMFIFESDDLKEMNLKTYGSNEIGEIDSYELNHDLFYFMISAMDGYHIFHQTIFKYRNNFFNGFGKELFHKCMLAKGKNNQFGRIAFHDMYCLILLFKNTIFFFKEESSPDMKGFEFDLFFDSEAFSFHFFLCMDVHGIPSFPYACSHSDVILCATNILKKLDMQIDNREKEMKNHKTDSIDE